MQPTSPIELTEREEAIAQRAAEIAVRKMTDEFYGSVGRTVINRLLIIIGAAFVAFAAGKGWLLK
jgi:chorismate mutase